LPANDAPRRSCSLAVSLEVDRCGTDQERRKLAHVFALWRRPGDPARCDRALRACALRTPKRLISVCASPEREGNRRRIDFMARPPCRLITVSVNLSMMKATNRRRELIADFAAQRPRLRKAKMMRIRRLAAAHDAWLLGHEFEVVLVAQANGLARRADAAAASFLRGSHRGRLSFEAGRRVRLLPSQTLYDPRHLAGPRSGITNRTRPLAGQSRFEPSAIKI
jgi:hypothetical protein